MKFNDKTLTELLSIREQLDRKLSEIKVAVHEALVQQGMAAPFITKTRAYGIYGRQTVDNWIKWGLIEEVKDGKRNSQVRLDLSRLIMLSGRSNRCEYFNTEQ